MKENAINTIIDKNNKNFFFVEKLGAIRNGLK